MNRNNKGSVLIEAALTLPILLTLMIFILELSLLSVSKSMIQWSCFDTARKLLVLRHEDAFKQSKVVNDATSFLSQIPFHSGPPKIFTQITPTQVHVQLSQSIRIGQIGGFNHVLKNKVSLYK